MNTIPSFEILATGMIHESHTIIFVSCQCRLSLGLRACLHIDFGDRLCCCHQMHKTYARLDECNGCRHNSQRRYESDAGDCWTGDEVCQIDERIDMLLSE